MIADMTIKLLEAAVQRASSLPQPAQDQIGREMLARVEALEQLRANISIGLSKLDSGQAKSSTSRR